MAVIAIAAVAACDLALPGARKLSLRTVRVSLPPGRTNDLLRQINVFAREQGFVFRTSALQSNRGRSVAFELRRRDIWIEGVNPLKPEPNDIPMPPNGRPEARQEIDEGIFVVGFYRGNIEPDASALESLVNAFIASAERVLGVTATLVDQSDG